MADRASVTLAAAAQTAAGWSVPYAAPLAELLRAEAQHADLLEAEQAGWDRYPPGSLLVALAKGVLEQEQQLVLEREQQRLRGVLICNNPDQHPPGCDCGNRRG